MKNRLNILILTFVFSFILVGSPEISSAQSGASCTGTGCGGPGGSSTCAAGYTCFRSPFSGEYHCNQSNGCLQEVGEECTGSGCGGSGSSCPQGQACVISPISNKAKCNPSNNCQSLPPVPGEGQAGDGAACTRTGCGDPICGSGYSCNNGTCEPDRACTGAIADIPYTGPRISSIGDLIGKFYNIFFPAALIIGILMIIKAGYELMTSEGNPQLAKVGQEDLTAAILGMLFVIMSGVILRIIITQILGGSVAF